MCNARSFPRCPSNRAQRQVKLAVSGSAGLVGRALTAHLEAEGHRVVRLIRPDSKPSANCARWNPRSGSIDAAALEGIDALVHLAGAGIGHRWTRRYKQEILRSRVEGTRLISQTLANLARPPQVLVSASATGYYGDRGDEELTEQSAPGRGFRADVCRQWEAAAEPAASAGIRVAILRFGVVLDSSGGLLRPLMLPARLGLSMRFGDGTQFLSWITRHDAVNAIVQTIEDVQLSGPINTCSPDPTTNAHFAQELSRALGKPALGYLPKPLLEALAGRERAQEVLLSSQRVLPEKLNGADFTFRHPEIRGGLRSAINACASRST